ncbi:MAG TPA: hypothetical protein VMT03_05505 [Polyangia bacterium]|nr:hypothetical protein [Polyangia bacterium]
MPYNRPCALLIAVALFLVAAPAHASPGIPPAPAPAAAPEPDLGEEQAVPVPKDLAYGVAARLRWVSVPGWLLNAFTKYNVPLSSWGTGAEIFRRHGNFDFVVGFTYQNMSPSDGNWLGSTADPVTETNFVQFKSFALWGFDASFRWHTLFTDWVGMHYGAGFGLGVLSGHIVRQYSQNCTAANVTDTSVCKPDPGEATIPTSVPSAVPILNVNLGVDFRIPRTKGLEVRLEGGFYDAFFLGGVIGYAYSL